MSSLESSIASSRGIDRPAPVTAALWLLALAAVIALVSFEQGQLTDGAPLLHELFHDARHLLGFPCH